MKDLEIIRELLPDINVSVIIGHEKAEVFFGNKCALNITGDSFFFEKTVQSFLYGFKEGIIKGRQYERKQIIPIPEPQINLKKKIRLCFNLHRFISQLKKKFQEKYSIKLSRHIKH